MDFPSGKYKNEKILHGIEYNITGKNSFYCRFATGILTFLLCSLFCQLPILFIHFNDLRVEFIKPQTVNNVRPTKLSREPYFLVEHDNATVMVNDSLEKVIQSQISFQMSFNQHFPCSF